MMTALLVALLAVQLAQLWTIGWGVRKLFSIARIYEAPGPFATAVPAELGDPSESEEMREAIRQGAESVLTDEQIRRVARIMEEEFGKDDALREHREVFGAEEDKRGE